MAIKLKLHQLKELLTFIALSYWCSFQLEKRQDNIKKIRKGDLLLFCTLRNEAHRLQYFLEYYRKLGVAHFIFVDNGSTDQFQTMVKAAPDITVFYTDHSYRKAKSGVHWLNSLLRTIGSGHWCLTCDPDEFLVYPNQQQMDLVKLTEFLSSVQRKTLFTTMVDMYGKGEMKDSVYQAATSPLTVSPYFDRKGYFYKHNNEGTSVWIQGGVRMRSMFSQDPDSAPALNKTPLINWRWHYFYLSSTHTARPESLNGGFREGITGALLHFKFIAAFEEKIAEEVIRREHSHHSIEYERYKDMQNGLVFYQADVSVKYTGWQQLVDLNIIRNKEFFH
jgi:hypothetical protein